MSTSPLLSGAFLQLNAGHLTEPGEAMFGRLGRMKAIGLDTVVIQFSAHNGTDLGLAVDRVFDAAESLGLRVWLGTPLDETRWWQEAWNPFFLYQFGTQAAWDARKAVKRWGDRPALEGVYIPYETNGCAVPWAMGDFYFGITAVVRHLRPGTAIMISPFTNLEPGRVGSLPPVVLAAWWDIVLDKAQIDVLAYQDGVGACGHEVSTATAEAQLGQVDTDLKALAWAANRYGVKLWANAEVFLRTTPLEQTFAATAAPFDRVQRQLATEAPWVDRLIAFDYNDYMDPTAGADQASLYAAYEAYRRTFA